MFSKNNTTMNNKKQYEKVNHYGIKKFNAGTASVLIASAFMFLGGAAQAADTNKQEATVAATEKATATEEKVETAKVETPAVAPKAEVKEEKTEEATAEKATAEKATAKEVNKTALQAKINQLDNLFVSLAGQELSETKQAQTVSAAVELNKAKDLVAQASATQEQVNAQVAALEAAINNLSKVEKTADKKEEAKKEEKSETKVAKENLEKAVSEAKAVNRAATTFETKQVKEEAKKVEIKAVVATSEKEIAKALDIFNSDSSTKEDADQQRKELEKAIEAVYVTMQRAGHRGKVESILADAATQDQKIVGKDTVKDGTKVKSLTNGYITMNADNTTPKAWGFDSTIDTADLQAGTITKIEVTNLAEFGAAFPAGKKITAADGTVIGKVKSIDYRTSTGNNNNKSVPYWAQRTQRGMTYDQRVAEQPAVANETGTYTYNIEWNEKVKDYPIVSFGAENLSGGGYLAPQISKDTPYKATIKIDGRTVVEHTYTRKGQQASFSKQATSASLRSNNGLGYVSNELKGKSDTLEINTDSDIRYGVGSKFTIKLPNSEFTEFKELAGSTNFVNGLNTASTINPNKGDSITYRLANRWANVKANENNVWILQDGREGGFTLTPKLISPTELEVTVTEGYIQEGSNISLSLQSLGVEKVIKNKTLTSEFSNVTYNEFGIITGGTAGNNKTAATLTVSGGTSINGEKEEVTTTVANGWEINASGSPLGEPPTGAVVIGLKELETGKIIGHATTKYDGNRPLNEDGTKDNTNVLGKKYDVSGFIPEIIKEVDGEEYVLANIPTTGIEGTLSVTNTRVRDIYSTEELKKNGLNASAYVTPVEYNYVKKTRVEEVNRTIKFVYADNVANLAGTDVFPSQTQTVSYKGTVKTNAEGKAEIDSNDKPIYINWKGIGDTNLPELAVPQKEGFVASVEKVPVQATTATDKDYEYVVTYTAIQRAKTTFVDEKGNAIPGVDAITEQGGSEAPLTKEADVKAKIKELENKGYELVSNTYPEGGKFDKDKDTDQEFKVTLKAKEVTVTPDQPKTPGTPVDPKNPEGPKYPAGLEEKDLNKTVTRTITYVYADGTPVLNEDGTPKTVTQEAKFTREAKVNLVTGEVTYGDWTPEQDLAEVKSPVVKEFLADKVTVPATKVTANSENTTEVVTYTPIGSWIPNIPGQPTNPIKYPNDPTDPTKPGKPTETLPYVPGYTPQDKDGNPLKPVDPKDPSKGYMVPDIPTNPGEDTPISYVANKVNLVVKYVDENGKDLAPAETTEGKVGDEYTTTGKVIDGYVLVRVEGDAKGKIGTEGSTVTYVYKPLGSWIPNIPGQPTNPIKYPNDPQDPTKPGKPTETLPYVPGYTPKDGNGQPLKPVDPQDPTKGYIVPDIPTDPGKDTVINYEANDANLVVKYVDEKGKELKPTETTKGKVGDDYTTEGKVIEGYVLVRVEGEAKGKIGKDGSTVTYVYKELGSWIPNIPGQPTSPIKYPNHPTDPTKPGKPTEVLPYVPGFTPEDKDGNPLKPVDPTDPSKGYIVPNIPTDPSQDTVINYVATEANLVVKYVDENGKDLIPVETTKVKIGDEYTTTGKVIKGYVLVRVEGETKGKIGKDGSTVTYVYQPLGSWVPNIPGQPTSPIKYPNDPQDPTKPGSDRPVLPYVPGYTPVDGNGNPLKPVDPQDPTKGYIVPDIPTNPGQDTPINYVANPQPQPNQDPTKPENNKPKEDQNKDPKQDKKETPENPGQNNAPVQPKANAQVKRLANTGTTETNTGLAGLGLATFAGMLAASRRRKEK